MNKMDTLHENSNENVYDMIHPKACSIKESDTNSSLFSRVFSLLYTRTRSNLFSSTDSVSSETGEVNVSRISHISPRNTQVTLCLSDTDEKIDTVKKHYKLDNIHDHYKNQTILERIQYYNTLCDMANVLRHIYYYFENDTPIFNYKSFNIGGMGFLIFNKGYREHIHKLEKYKMFQIEKDKSCHEITRERIFTIYNYLLQYEMMRTNTNYPILIYQHFIWYESYIYMRTIPLHYILYSNLSNGPIGCKICKEYTHPTLNIFQNYCEYCFQEIKSRMNELSHDPVPETNI